MDFNLYAQIVLLTIATLLAVFTEFKGDVEESRKKLLRFTSISLIVIALVVGVSSEFLKSAKEKRTEEQQSVDRAQRIKSENETLDKINVAYKSIKAIQLAMSAQLDSQKRTNSLAQGIIVTDQKISKTQYDMIEENDRALNPAFPFNIDLELRISFDHPSIKSLKAYLLRYKDSLDKNHIPIGNKVLPAAWEYIFLTRDTTKQLETPTYTQEVYFTNESDFRGEALSDYHNLISLYFSFDKRPPQKTTGYPYNKSSIFFHLNGVDNDFPYPDPHEDDKMISQEISVDYTHKEITVHLIELVPQFAYLFYGGFNRIISFRDLNGQYLIISTGGAAIGSVGFYSLSGERRKIVHVFTNNDRLAEDLFFNTTYVHKITSSDF